jgi:integrase
MSADKNVGGKTGRSGARPLRHRAIGRLSPALVRTAKPPPGKRELKLADGGNLFLLARRAGDDGHVTRRWQFEYELHGRRRWMGLGPLHTIGLAAARQRARELREELVNGRDPLAAKRAAVQAQIAEQAGRVTFRECSEMYVALHEAGWSFKHRRAFVSTLRDYAFPQIGNMSVRDIDTAVLLRILSPIWTAKPPTASRLKNRLESVMDFAVANGFHGGPNPAAALAAALPRTGRIHKVQHHSALPYADVPALMAALRALATPAAKCLQLLIHTACRSGEARGAMWDEFNLKEGVWTIPSHRMKARKEHRVPLSGHVLDLLQSMPRDGDLVFGPTLLNDKALSRLVHKLSPTASTHGLRSSFRDWVRESTSFPDIVAEMALAHRPGDASEKAYARGDVFAKRVRLMQAWSDYLARPAPAAADVVTSLRKAR